MLISSVSGVSNKVARQLITRLTQACDDDDDDGVCECVCGLQGDVWARNALSVLPGALRFVN